MVSVPFVGAAPPAPLPLYQHETCHVPSGTPARSQSPELPLFALARLGRIRRLANRIRVHGRCTLLRAGPAGGTEGDLLLVVGDPAGRQHALTSEAQWDALRAALDDAERRAAQAQRLEVRAQAGRKRQRWQLDRAPAALLPWLDRVPEPPPDGAAIAAERQRLGLLQPQLGALAGTVRQTVAEVERGVRGSPALRRALWAALLAHQARDDPGTDGPLPSGAASHDAPPQVACDGTAGAAVSAPPDESDERPAPGTTTQTTNHMDGGMTVSKKRQTVEIDVDEAPEAEVELMEPADLGAGLEEPEGTPPAAGSGLVVTCAQGTLHKALAIAGRAAAGRTSLPVLSHVLLRTGAPVAAGHLELSATDLDVGLRVTCAAKVGGEGSVVVPAKLLSDLVASLPSGSDVTLTADGAGLVLTAARQRASLRGITADEFPPLPSPTDWADMTLPAGSLRRAIGLVAPFAARDESRPVLTGVGVTLETGRVTFAAADGFRLARYHFENAGGPAEALTLIVPRVALVELAKLLPDGDTLVEGWVTPNKGQLVVSVPRGDGEAAVVFVCRLLEGQFPDFERVIPKTTSTTVVVERAGFGAAVRTARLFARDAAEVVRLEVPATASEDAAGAEGALIVSARAAESGDHRGELAAQVTGEAVTVSGSAVYLREACEALGVAGVERVRLGLTGPLSPMRLEGEGLDGWIAVIMPMEVTR